MSPASLRKPSTQGSLYTQGYPASPVSERRSKMEVVFPYCAGLDVHKKRVTACRLVSDSTGQAPEGVAELQTFGTMTHELLALADWLAGGGGRQGGVGRYGGVWKPVYNLLEGMVTIFLV